MIVVIDYEAGNLRSVCNALSTTGHEPVVTSDSDDLKRASAIVLPGVGAFGDGMNALRRRNLIDALQKEVLIKKKPYLGICLGMQFLAQESQEMGRHAGLGWINGVVRKIKPCGPKFRIPHIGWNNVEIITHNPLFEGLEKEPVFYFVHSYQLEVAQRSINHISSTCWHGEPVTASVQKENIFGIQFHPEKSQQAGLKVLENFVKLI